jgi:hypothetical protein
MSVEIAGVNFVEVGKRLEHAHELTTMQRAGLRLESIQQSSVWRKRHEEPRLQSFEAFNYHPFKG